jgi:endonuclease YncB( thermonuclease family)
MEVSKMITDTRKSWLSDNFFATGRINSTALLKAIKSDLENDSDVNSNDISWMFSVLGSTYIPPTTGIEVTARIVAINSGTSVSVLLDCISGNVCDYTPKSITLYGIVTTEDNDVDAESYLNLHLPIGSNVTLTPMGNSYIITKGTENINESLGTYLTSLPMVTPVTGSTISARVLSITDGDTFEANQICPVGQLCVTTQFTVRLEGISSSELKFQSGRTAKTWLGEHIPPGSIVRLVIKGMDSYNRQVAQVYYPDDININNTMILEGQAKTYNPEAESIVAKQVGVQISSCVSNNAPATKLATLEMVAPVCNYVKAPPAETWFGYKVRNRGNAVWKGWLGVILHGTSGDFEYTGMPQYQVSVPANGSEVTLWAKFVVPTNIGNLRTWDAILNSTS